MSGFESDVAPFVTGMSDRLEEMFGGTSIDFPTSYETVMDGMDDAKDAFSSMARDMVDVWRESTEEMAEMMSEVVSFDTNTFGSPFARGVIVNTSQQQVRQPTTINAILELDRVQFGRLVYQINNEERQRVGVNLSGGYA